MARSFNFKDKIFSVGDTIDVIYKIVEGDKERKGNGCKEPAAIVLAASCLSLIYNLIAVVVSPKNTGIPDRK